MRLAATDFGLTRQTIIEQDSDGTLALLIDRKSRIIMADGRKIIDKIIKIREKLPGVSIVIKTSAPVCSKTNALLEKQQIRIESL
ncbi:hypothetical protein [Desulfopila sp. IMCC35008]|uniref:hypothetical protein n=1 Tax=Desulfopila sp. IMCC35008 TaxID=2653858 RepID=UPI0013CFEA12|nr:hypothetical protein [Desulfopila sp. IMCC35008]